MSGPMARAARRLALLTMASLLHGCMLANTPKVRQGTLESDYGFVATDARQRVITQSQVGNFARPGLVDPNRITCTEPSPDAATSIATQLGGALSVFGKGSASLSSSHAEALVALAERTASIQLLRDKMYQTCLAYANGAISGTTYTLIMSQLDQTIVTLLLGETAGGAFGRAGPSASTSAIGQVEAAQTAFPGDADARAKAVDEVSELLKDLEAKQSALTAKRAECDAKKADDSTKADCSTQKESDAVADAKRKLEAYKLVLGGANAAVLAAAKGESATGYGGLSRTPSADVARELVKLQDNFLFTDGTASFLPTCLVELASQQDNRSGALLSLDALLGQLAAARQERDFAREELEAALARNASIEKQRREAAGDSKILAKMETPLSAEKINDLRRRSESADASYLKFETSVTEFARSANAISMTAIADPTSPMGKIFEQLMASEKDSSKRRPALADVIAAAQHASGETKLSRICTQELPAFVIQARTNSQSLRRKRLELQSEIALAEASARTAEAGPTMLKSFQDSLAACSTMKAGDDVKASCHSAVVATLRRYSAAAPTADATSSKR